MRKSLRLFRLSSTAAIAALLCNAVLPMSATAQPGPAMGVGPGAGQPEQYQGDPPVRVGRVAKLSGVVSFRTSADAQWTPASTNFPVSTGNSFWTDNAAQASLELSDSRIVLAPQTELDMTTLDQSGLQGVLPQGEIYVHLEDLAPNEAWTLQTPRGSVKLTAGGRYGIAIGSTEAPTQVTVLDGAAEIDGPGVALRVNQNETATITGANPFQGAVGPAVRDGFLSAQLNAERPPPRPMASMPSQIATQVAAMPGGSDLYSTGSWSESPDYGHVWYPPVQSGWAPYRHGHWAFVAPWGWTWVDDAPWGFAPFHYGRWVEIDHRWAWTPGVLPVSGPAIYSPVYAPALVAFVGIGVGAAVGAAFAGGNIGWIPLAPREVYHPWYHASDNYFHQVNVNHVANISNATNISAARSTNINNTTMNNSNVTVNNFVNRNAATVVPASVMTSSRPVQTAAQTITPQQLATATPVLGQQPVRPVAATAGVTPSVAKQFNLPPAIPGSVRPAPGPAVIRAAAAPAGALSRPVLPRTLGGQPVTTPAAAAVPHPPGTTVQPNAAAAEPKAPVGATPATRATAQSGLPNAAPPLEHRTPLAAVAPQPPAPVAVAPHVNPSVHAVTPPVAAHQTPAPQPQAFQQAEPPHPRPPPVPGLHPAPPAAPLLRAAPPVPALHPVQQAPQHQQKRPDEK